MPTNGQFIPGEVLTAGNVNSLLSRGYQNRIINGAFEINQRGYASGTNLASGAYGFDRWKSGYTNTSLTFTDGVQSTTVTISSSGVIQQIVEQANMPAGTYTLSWSGTATGRVYNSGGSAPSYAASPVTVTLDGSANVVVEFTASGGTKTLGTVQLEGGTVFSPFEYRLRGEELQLCQRYFEKSYDLEIAPGTDSFNGLVTQAYISGSSVSTSVRFLVAKRATPTLTFYTRIGVINNWTQPGVGAYAASSSFVGHTGFCVSGGGSGGAQGHFIASAEL